MEGKLISSRLSPIYKYYLPVIIFICVLINILMIFLSVYPANNISIFIVLEVILIIWQILFIPFTKLKLVTIINDEIIVYSLLRRCIFPISSIIKVNRYFLFLYKIRITHKDKTTVVIILPKITELYNIFVIPKSLKLLTGR
jgi:hypothetical protein